MLRFNLGCIGQYSWPAAGENHRRDKESTMEKGDIRPACLADAGSCYQPTLHLIYVVSYNQTPSFICACTPLLPPHRRIFMWMNVWLLCKHWLAGQRGEEFLNLSDISSVPQVPIAGGRALCFQEKFCSEVFVAFHDNLTRSWSAMT